MLRNFIIFSALIILLSPTFDFQAMALTQNSQNILSNVHNFEQSKSVPATSQIYSPNDSPPEVNVVPTPKTNMISPTTQLPYSSTTQSPHSPISQSQTSSQGNEQTNQPWIVVLVVLLVFIAVAIGAVKKIRSTSYNRPDSPKYNNSD